MGSNTFIGKKISNDDHALQKVMGTDGISSTQRANELAARQAAAQSVIDKKKGWATINGSPTTTTGGMSTLG